jgi:hypothetical protein
MESRETAEPSKQPSRAFRLRPLHAAVLIPALAAAGLWAWRYHPAEARQAKHAAGELTFAGGSKSLERTTVFPTLDTPMLRRRNVIWCSSFQLAWNELRDEVIGAPVEVIGAENIAARLNAAKQSLADLDEQSVYANGGWVEKGICETIKGDMAAKFPSHVLPDFNDYTEGILTYSYLTAHVPFAHPFRQMDWGLGFVDSRGHKTLVACFGLWQARSPEFKNIREQVEILYVSQDPDQSGELTEYALDLCRHSTPYQVVVARVEPKGSLAETVEHIRTRMGDFKRQPDYEEARWLDPLDELRVPEMCWRIDHRFAELIGKGVANVGMPIIEALQTIEFRLDRSGAMVESDAMVTIASRPRYFEFNRPFLVYMQKRGAEHPFFVMWVDNAELLVRE